MAEIIEVILRPCMRYTTNPIKENVKQLYNCELSICYNPAMKVNQIKSMTSLKVVSINLPI